MEQNKVLAADGARLSYLSTGTGRGLVIVPGNNRRAHHYEALATELAPRFRVHVLDRRGRGLSSPQPPGYSIETEVGDVLTLLRATESDVLFGHSYGGLIALHVALWEKLAALAVYEPGVSIDGSFDGSFLPEFSRLLSQKKPASAMALFLQSTKLTPLGNAPMLVFKVLAWMLLRGKEGADMLAMMPATPAETAEIVRLDSDASRYAAITSPTLLLGGSKTPEYLTGVLPKLENIIPNAKYELISGLDHNAPDLNAPKLIADRLRIAPENWC